MGRNILRIFDIALFDRFVNIIDLYFKDVCKQLIVALLFMTIKSERIPGYWEAGNEQERRKS